MGILGRAHNCLGNFESAIESYQKIISQEELDQNHVFVWMEICLLHLKLGNKAQVKKYQKLFEKNFKFSSEGKVAQLLLLVNFYLKMGNQEKVIEYLLPLTNKVIEDICFKSLYSNNDNTSDKDIHDDILRILLNLNNSEYYDSQLSANAALISNLYKKKIDFYGEVNRGIQKLEVSKNVDAMKLKKLKEQFNNTPTMLLSEEISQVTSKIIGSRIVQYDDLCNIDYGAIFNTINENEIVADLISYKQVKYKVETYAINFHYYSKGSTITEIFLEEDKMLKSNKILISGFFDNLLHVISENLAKDGELIDTFYIIPSGKSNFINFSALSLSLENKLGREITVHVINSLVDISKIKKEEEKKIDNLILIGDIDFDKIANYSSKNLKNQTRGIQLTTSIKDSGIPFWGYLPGTKQEIESIEKIALDNNINTLILREKEVTQSNLNNLLLGPNKNNVIHIATHGYFFPDNSEEKTDNLFASHQNPLLRSGLILSGANDNWNNKSLVGSHNDGILTAEEISFMDLSGVELVVLSACDTGLGDVSNLEGINGLQRAFKLAGANKLIMSLWKVPDKETAEFFKHFYKFLLDDKRSINESFRYTQKVMNEKYEPYYWASFVLLE
jgi:CHAT domain-containing protein